MPPTAYVPGAAVYVRDKQQGWAAATVVAVYDTARPSISLRPPCRCGSRTVRSGRCQSVDAVWLHDRVILRVPLRTPTILREAWALGARLSTGAPLMLGLVLSRG